MTALIIVIWNPALARSAAKVLWRELCPPRPQLRHLTRQEAWLEIALATKPLKGIIYSNSFAQGWER